MDINAYRSSLLDTIESNVARTGLHITAVGFGGCSFPGCDCGASPLPWAYTIGRAEIDLPEFVTIGVGQALSHRLINELHRRQMLGEPLDVDDATEVAGELVRLEAVPEAWLVRDPGRMGTWFEYYHSMQPAGMRLPTVQQIVVATPSGRFPGDPGCSDALWVAQPRLALDPVSFPAAEGPNRAQRRAEARHLRAARARRR